ncbi:MAG: hypothetical protein E4G99_13095 [Anaerolineales bacterium]|nr:MAG: hypothetical protein E4G99_13095 [Anaerolineales bacterium]
MAELLLDKQARVRLGRLLDGKSCPAEMDRMTFSALQRGERSAVTIRSLATIENAHGNIVAQTFPGLKP